VQQPAERRLEQREHHLRLGIAEAAVELDDLRPAGGHGQAGVEQAGERRAAAAQLVDHGLQHLALHLLDDAVGQPGQRRVGAHAAGVGSGVAVADRLWSWAGSSGSTVVPSVSANSDTSGPSR
jgi:hypothetical protein